MIADAKAFDATTRAAVRFFWVWLIVATGVSVAGNVAHAVMARTDRDSAVSGRGGGGAAGGAVGLDAFGGASG